MIKFEDDDGEELMHKVTPAYLINCDDYKQLLGVQFANNVNTNTNSNIIFIEQDPALDTSSTAKPVTSSTDDDLDSNEDDGLKLIHHLYGPCPFSSNSRIFVLLNQDIPSSINLTSMPSIPI